MTGKTHALAGGAAGIAILALSSFYSASPPLDKLVVVPLSIIGSLIPDCDLPKSTAGKMMWPISLAVNKCFGHRTITHSLTFWGLLFWCAIRASPAFLNFIIPFAVGVLTHLFLDLFNRTGIALLWPVNKKFSVASVPLSGIVEHGICFACACSILYFVGKQGILFLERSGLL